MPVVRSGHKYGINVRARAEFARVVIGIGYRSLGPGLCQRLLQGILVHITQRDHLGGALCETESAVSLANEALADDADVDTAVRPGQTRPPEDTGR